jgi:hypothetical protein
MKHFRINGVTFAFVLVLMLGVGCDRKVAPPVPLPVEQLPSALEKAFIKAKPEAKDLANQIVASLQAQDYSKAYTLLQNLLGKPGLTKEQMDVTIRGSLTVNTLLQSAQAKGDSKAAETLKSYRVNK